MSSSAARRLATPDRARNLFNLSRGAERGPLGGSPALMRPTPPTPRARGLQQVRAARHPRATTARGPRGRCALAALLVASLGSGPPGSPNVSPSVPVRASAFEELRAVAWRREVIERLDARHLQEAHRRPVELGLAWARPPPHLRDQVPQLEVAQDALAVDPAHLLDARSGNRLLIGDDGEGFVSRLRQPARNLGSQRPPHPGPVPRSRP